MLNSFNSNGIRLTGRFIEGRITHYLKFSVKITTNQLHYHFKNKVPFLEKEVSRFNLKQSNSLISRNTLSLK